MTIEHIVAEKDLVVVFLNGSHMTVNSVKKRIGLIYLFSSSLILPITP